MTIAESIRALAPCPKCHVVIGAFCAVPSRRNHAERVRAALREALAQEAETRASLAEKLGLR